MTETRRRRRGILIGATLDDVNVLRRARHTVCTGGQATHRDESSSILVKRLENEPRNRSTSRPLGAPLKLCCESLEFG